MPASKTARVKKPVARKTPRVSGDGKASTVSRSAGHRALPPDPVPEGMIEITGQASELVPVAQYANVTVGPVAARRLINDPGLSELVGVNPDDWNDDQQAIAQRFKDEIAVMNMLIQEVIADDREAVEESVRLHNQREAEEAKAAAKGRGK